MAVRIALILVILFSTTLATADDNDAAKKRADAAAAAKKRLEEARARQAAALAQRGIYRGNSYPVREKVDRSDPKERFLLLLPGNPLVVEAAITIDGKPFREPQEKLIDEMIALADADKDGKATWVEAINNRRFFFGQTVTFANEQQRDRYLAGMDLNRDGLVDRYECRALIAGRSSGPAFTLAATSAYGYGAGGIVLQNGRVVRQGSVADVAPLLDEDEDGVLSAEEIAAAPEQLKKRDANDNDLLESNELQPQAAATGRNAGGGIVVGRGSGTTQRLFVLLGPTAKAEDLYNALRRDSRGITRKLTEDGFCGMSADLFKQLDTNQDGEVEPKELLGLNRVEPHVKLKVGLGKSFRGMMMEAAAKGLNKLKSTSEQTVGVSLPGVKLAFAADPTVPQSYYNEAYGKRYVDRYDRNKNGYIDKAEMDGRLTTQFQMFDENTDDKVYADEIVKSLTRQIAPRMSQVRAALASQGNSLFTALDGSGDGRLSLREMRESAKRIKTFDKNEDGRVTKQEIPITMLVTFSQGPLQYRRPLVASGGVARPATPPGGRGPDWFVRMDRNGDGDVTLREFLGTPEQFKKLDTNSDGFIEPKEAEAVSKAKD